MEWFLGLDLFNKIFLLFCLSFCISIICDTYVKDWYRNYHPKFRMNNDGLIEYYSLYYHCWRIFYFWNDKEEYRVLHIHDTIRGFEYDVKYIGKGRSAFKYDTKQYDLLCKQYKRVKEIDNEQNNLIDKEDTYLKEKILNH